MEPQKPDNSPGPGPEVVERQKIAKERAAQRARSWTAQNEMRGVLGRVSASAARRILNSANLREIGAVTVAAKASESTANVTREHKFLGGN